MLNSAWPWWAPSPGQLGLFAWTSFWDTIGNWAHLLGPLSVPVCAPAGSFLRATFRAHLGRAHWARAHLVLSGPIPRILVTGPKSLKFVPLRPPRWIRPLPGASELRILPSALTLQDGQGLWNGPGLKTPYMETSPSDEILSVCCRPPRGMPSSIHDRRWSKCAFVVCQQQ